MPESAGLENCTSAAVYGFIPASEMRAAFLELPLQNKKSLARFFYKRTAKHIEKPRRVAGFLVRYLS